jgi:chemotaxis response regulator CheB
MAVVNRVCSSPGERIRVLVVDDSVVIRRLVTHALEQDPMIEVVGVPRTAPSDCNGSRS